MGFIANDPVLYSHSPAAEIQRQVVKTKTLGNPESTPMPRENESKRHDEHKAVKEVQQAKSDAIAQRARAEIIDRAAEMRHLKYEVIEDADIVQVSVIRRLLLNGLIVSTQRNLRLVMRNTILLELLENPKTGSATT